MIETENKLAISWLKNGIWALALAGFYSIVLVILRTPQLSQIISDKSVFKSSLVIHVNLSVLAWLLSITCIIWSYGSRRLYFSNIFSKLALAGIALMTISPLIGQSNPIMNNYVPILENVWFIIGLSLFGSSILYFSILVFINSFHDFSLKEEKYTAQILPVVKLTSSLMYIMVWGCFALSYKEVMALSNVFPIEIDYYYELLFWSGGHLLQFIYTQIVMFVWLILAELWIGKRLIYYEVYSSLFIINFILSLFVFYGHLAYQMPEYEFTVFFTKHMQYCGGIAPTLLMAVLIIDIFKFTRIKNHLSFVAIAFMASILVFFAGGLIGVLISGINLSIPAHYHGSIVGISIGFLGFAYIFCFRDSGFATPDQTLSKKLFTFSLSLKQPIYGSNSLSCYSKWPNIQLIIITFGQLLHIAGLALAGGYGILRKNPDGEIALAAKFYMGILGGGGLIAIIGGLMFVYICAKRLYAL
ncbi:cbb3-type cytochrome c oxidase subunit I [Candidatus Megaera polyxenophila]|uniref:cbb3-type cytochrome c oxidase subunit I n=1 Tax=Candidatus Megaera polyxenophila TaxID=988779 RepID=UPI00249F7271|nr:cbb3-type cytochrome c oxidase subunit I [Candidatus Megaera polyxenophila]